MIHLEFEHSLADPDVWMRPAKKSDGSSCYEYILLYTDDVLIISDNADSPKLYLGGHVRKVELVN